MTKKSVAKEVEPSGNGYIPQLAIDAVIFGFHDRVLRVLLMRYSKIGLHALPGGFIQQDEDLNQAARRVASERTGLTNVYLEQFYTFGDVSRYDPTPFAALLKANGQEPGKNHWLLQRFISVGYFALVDIAQVSPSPDKIFDRCDWYQLNALPSLIQDHTLIVKKALEALRNRIDDTLLLHNLLPQEFTMNDLQVLYETILGKKLLRPAFQRKMLGLGILERVSKKYSGGAHKAPYLYCVKKK